MTTWYRFRVSVDRAPIQNVNGTKTISTISPQVRRDPSQGDIQRQSQMYSGRNIPASRKAKMSSCQNGHKTQPSSSIDRIKMTRKNLAWTGLKGSPGDGASKGGPDACLFISSLPWFINKLYRAAGTKQRK